MKPGRYFALAEETKDTKTSAVSKYLTMLVVATVVPNHGKLLCYGGFLLEKKLATTVFLRVATMEGKMEASAWKNYLEATVLPLRS